VWLPWAWGDDRTRRAIEDQYAGVHNWIPRLRGETYTRPWLGYHPLPIVSRMTALRERWARELEEVPALCS